MFDPKHIAEIRGWLDPEEGIWLNQQAQRMNSIIEIGSWCGRSTYCLLEGCKGLVYAVDTFLGSKNEPQWQQYALAADVYKQFLDNVGHYQNLRIVRKEARQAAQDLPAQVDMVWIDGCHTEEEVGADIDQYGPRARVLLCGHDYGNPNTGVKQAVNSRFVAEIVGSIWYVWKDKTDAPLVDSGRGRLSRKQSQPAAAGRKEAGRTGVQDNPVHGPGAVQSDVSGGSEEA